MTAEERAELEVLRQQQRASPRKGQRGGGGVDEDVLQQLKTLPEDEAVALLLQVRSETRVNQVSSGNRSPGPSPCPGATGSGP